MTDLNTFRAVKTSITNLRYSVKGLTLKRTWHLSRYTWWTPSSYPIHFQDAWCQLSVPPNACWYNGFKHKLCGRADLGWGRCRYRGVQNRQVHVEPCFMREDKQFSPLSTDIEDTRKHNAAMVAKSYPDEQMTILWYPPVSHRSFLNKE